jgi:AraC family transcriptional regulator
MDMHAMNSVSWAPGHVDASPYGALSRLQGSHVHEWSDTLFAHDHGRRMHDRTRADALDAAVEITPPEAMTRHRSAWHGMAGFTFVEGLPQSELRNCRGKLVFVPSGHEYFDEREPSGVTRVTYIHFDPAALPVNPDLGPGEMPFAPRLFFEDSGLWDTAIKLKALIESPQASDRLYRESLGVVLAHEIMRLGSAVPRIEPPVRGGLAGWQQGAVTRHIEEHLDEQIPLATLAQIARLSPYHFCRAFKQSFGIPPHRFHMRRRIERAKSLLAKSASVTSVGMALGFSETSSFTAAFRRVTGLTPTGYQRTVT